MALIHYNLQTAVMLYIHLSKLFIYILHIFQISFGNIFIQLLTLIKFVNKQAHNQEYIWAGRYG